MNEIVFPNFYFLNFLMCMMCVLSVFVSPLRDLISRVFLIKIIS